MPINDKQRGDLFQMIQSPGYQVFLDLGHEEAEKLVTVLMQEEARRSVILARHKVARAARIFFDALCIRADREAKSILQPEKTAPLPVDFVREVDSPGDLPPDFIPEEWSGKKGPIITG
jgi:hypothetical protein